jgi:O-antigen ligase
VAASVRARRPLSLALAGLVAVGLLFTFSRASIAAAALGLCVVALVLRRPWAIAAAAALVVAGVGFARVFPDVAPRAHWTKQELVEQRKHARQNGGTAGTGLGESSTRSHFASLRAGVRTVVHHPQGFGLGNAGETASRTHVKLKAGESTYTELGVEAGLLGALAFIAWNLALLEGLLRRAREREIAVAAVAASLVAILALAVQTDVLGVPWLALCLWWIAGSLLTPADPSTLE